MIDNIELIAQSAIRIKNENQIIYFDPFKLDETYKNDADIIFITHSHYDHFSIEDITKIKKETTKIVIPKDLIEKVEKLNFSDVLIVEPNKEYKIDGIAFKTTYAYNINKDFHKLENNWVGYLLTLNGKIIYVAGDTDNIPEARDIKCNIAFVPIGGTYTMNFKEAAEMIKEIKPELAIPTHYHTIVGTKEDAIKFKELLNGIADVRILLKEN